jgi:hypothetical protein
MNDLLYVLQYVVLSLVQSGLAVHREQALLHLCVKSYKVPHALHTYLFAVGSLIFVIML